MLARSFSRFGQFSGKGFALSMSLLMSLLFVAGPVHATDFPALQASEDEAAARRSVTECDPEQVNRDRTDCRTPVQDVPVPQEAQMPPQAAPVPAVGQIGGSNAGGPGSIIVPQSGEGNAAQIVTIRASRIFAAPTQFPPEDFRAYGIVAFPSRATSHDRERHVMICEAYVAALPHADMLSMQPKSNQMVTVWPVEDAEAARRLNGHTAEDVCPQAVDGYSLVAAQQAILEARRTGLDLSSRGPFLLAWSPSTSKGQEDALVLVADLSDVDTPERCQEIMLRWTSDIEKDPALWGDGWDLELLRVKLRDWVDDIGPKILGTVGF